MWANKSSMGPFRMYKRNIWSISISISSIMLIYLNSRLLNTSIQRLENHSIFTRFGICKNKKHIFILRFAQIALRDHCIMIKNAMEKLGWYKGAIITSTNGCMQFWSLKNGQLLKKDIILIDKLTLYLLQVFLLSKTKKLNRLKPKLLNIIISDLLIFYYYMINRPLKLITVF